MLELKGIAKKYTTAGFTQVALDHVSVSFRDNEFVAILGPSGSGKTTMLNVVGGLDHFDEGDLVIDGISTSKYKDRDWDAYRNNRIGFVFQSYNLIPHQTILANVELALTLSGVGRAERRRRAQAALEQVGLGEHVNKRPSQLSGGQMQRVAIARALINDPEILLADEPTGALDSATSVQVMDLLKEVAKDRLVVMVTHNPELAREYATRIVELKDGHIVSDSDPFDPSEADRRAAKPPRKTRMSFFTALGLSANNLMTKKGRTILTAFAGSIGIIGIAAILALSNGVNEYIATVEENTLSSYPLSISKQSYDITSMLTGDSSDDDTDADAADADAAYAEAPAAADADASEIDTSSNIPKFTMLTDMFASVKSNDLGSFKAYLDSDDSGIDEYVNAIKYDYGITPLVYASSTEDGVTQLNPNSLYTAMTSGASSTATAGSMGSGSTAYSEMLDDQELLDSQYDVVCGRWATEENEAVLVLTKSGRVSDYVLYALGVLDPDDLNEMVSEAMSGTAGTSEVSDADVDFTYEDALGLSFKVLAASDVYRKNDETGGWTDMSDDEAFMAGAVDNGLDLHIVGVVMPNGTSDANALSAGVNYTHKLTLALMERAQNSEIVQQQLADPETDVFTGSTFDELQDQAKQGVDLGSLFSVDEAALASAFSFDTTALSAGLALDGADLSGMDLSGIDLSGVDLSGLTVDLSGIASSVDLETLLADAPSPDFSAIAEELQNDPPLSADEIKQTLELGGQLASGFVRWLGEDGGQDLDPLEEGFVEKLGEKFDEYVATEEAEALLAQIKELAGEPVLERIRAIVRDYVTGSLAPYLTQFMQQITSQISSAVSSQIQASMQSIMQQVAYQIQAQVADQLGSALVGMQSSLASSLTNAFSVNADAIAGAITFNMDAEDLTSLMTSYANASSLTYENNLTTLGYATEDEPAAISIYPKDFEAKESVLSIIDAYNAEQEAAGNDDATIVYTDYVGVIMGSVTNIVNMISLVLIAFVSISLVVSSIMIGIITYISVLERKKEIGILRAIGASKGNVASVFNAETFIEGLISGLFAIAVVYVASVPVNAYVLRVHNVPNIMSLPWTSALALIGISVALTLVAGLIPSSAASRRDPVEALRSE